MNKKRPVNLNLFAFHFPLPAITSILHRISGFLLFLLIPIFLWVLASSLHDPESFYQITDYLNHPLAKLGSWVVLSALIYHLIAGVKHLFMDFGVGESLQGARIGAWLTLLLTIILSGLIGVWLWLPL